MKIDIRNVLENKLSPAEQEAEFEQTAKSESAGGATIITTDSTSDSNSEQAKHIVDSQVEAARPEIVEDAAAETITSFAAETTELSEIDNTSAIDNDTSSLGEATRITADISSDSVSEQAEHVADSQAEPAESEIADAVAASDSSSMQAELAADSEAEAESAANSDLAAEAGEKAAGDFADTKAETEVAETESPVGTFKIWLNKYGSLVAIAAAMIVLLAVLFAYTTMTPRTIYAEIDGSKTKIVTKKHTVEGFITDEGISYCEEDFISRPLTCFVHDGMELEITHATDFSVTADGKTVCLKSLEKTVGEALEDKGYNIRKRDIVTPERDALLEQNMKIVVQRVETEKITVKEKVPFKTVNKDDSSMAEGETKVITEGKHGKDKVTYEVTYIDGKEASRQETARENIKPAADEVVAVGTKVKYNGKLYSRKLLVKAYSYTGGGTTAMGTRARVGEIAVDPSVIPLGTNVYIPGVGARRAEDTGGNIKGNTIDIYMNTQSECINWGVRYITIYIE